MGKSTATVLLAVGLQRAGAKVGVLDADIYGPSIPTMTGLSGCKPSIRDDKIVPLEACGIKVMSIGFMLNPEQAVVWRGPMVHGAIKQVIDQVEGATRDRQGGAGLGEDGALVEPAVCIGILQHADESAALFEQFFFFKVPATRLRDEEPTALVETRHHWVLDQRWGGRQLDFEAVGHLNWRR